MDAPMPWQWRAWRGGRVPAPPVKDPAMPLPQSSVASRQASADHTPVPAVPPAPDPVDADQPAPRVVWEDPGGHTVRLVAVDWADGVAPTYAVQAAHGSSWWAEGDGTLWVPATGEEWMAMFIALASALDERTPRQEPTP